MVLERLPTQVIHNICGKVCGQIVVDTGVNKGYDMFVKCKVKTILEKPVEFLLNVESIATMGKLVDENKLNLHLNTGDFEFWFDSEEIKDEVYNAFTEFLATKQTVISDNISLLTL